MNDALLVRGIEGECDLQAVRQRLPWADGPGTDQITKRRTGHELHDDRRAGAGVFDAIDLGDVRMVEGCEQAGFARKPLTPIIIVDDPRRKDFDGDVTRQSMVTGAEHHAHSAGADRFDNLVWPDP